MARDHQPASSVDALVVARAARSTGRPDRGARIAARGRDRRRRDHADLRRRGHESRDVPLSVGELDALARAHRSREAAAARPRRRHGHRHGLAVRRAVGRRRRRRRDRSRSGPGPSRAAGRLTRTRAFRAAAAVPRDRNHRRQRDAPADRGSQGTGRARTPNLQALALEQVRFPKPLPLLALVALLRPTATPIDLTGRVGADGTLDWTAPPGAGRCTACSSAGTARWWSAPRPAARATSSITSRATRSGTTSRDSTRLRRPRARRACARSSTTPTKWTTRRGRRTGRRRCSTSSSAGAATTCGGTCPRCSGRPPDDDGAARPAPTTARRSRICCSTRSPTEWRALGAPARRDRRATRRTARPATCSTSTPRATFPRPRGPRSRAFKWAASAAHVAGRPLVSAEAATWLGEHFRSTLADVRDAVDRFFVAGVNHIVYHGTAYSPRGRAWPGWLFYASVEFNPRNPWWDHFRALNEYVARAQSFLQAGHAGSRRAGLLPVLRFAGRAAGRRGWRTSATPNPPAEGTAFEAAASALQQRGFTHDFISDRQLASRRVSPADGWSRAAADRYKTLVRAGEPLHSARNVRAHRSRSRATGAVVVPTRGCRRMSPGHAELERGRARLRTLRDGVRVRPAGRGRRPGSHRQRPDARAATVSSALLARAGRRARNAGRPRPAVRPPPPRRRARTTSSAIRPTATWTAGSRSPTRAGAAVIFDPMTGRRGDARTAAEPAARWRCSSRIPRGTVR